MMEILIKTTFTSPNLSVMMVKMSLPRPFQVDDCNDAMVIIMERIVKVVIFYLEMVQVLAKIKDVKL